MSSGPAIMREQAEKKTEHYGRKEPVDYYRAITEGTLFQAQEHGSYFVWLNVPRVSNHLESYEQVVEVDTVPGLPQIQLLELLSNLPDNTRIFRKLELDLAHFLSRLFTLRPAKINVICHSDPVHSLSI